MFAREIPAIFYSAIRYIAMKSETSAKHLRKISKKIRLYFGKQYKKIKNTRKYNENGSSFLQKLFQHVGRSVVLEV